MSSAGKAPYCLGVGKDDEQALQRQHDLFGEDSYAHVSKACIGPGHIVWDVGCGSGIMTVYLAEQVGFSGKVYAIDQSVEQLEIVKSRIASLGLNNVEFIQADIMNEKELLNEMANLIHTRFLFMYLTDPEKVLGILKSKLQPSGFLSVQ